MEEKHKAIKSAGYSGVQDGDPKLCSDLELELTAHARINKVGELDELVPKWKAENYNCATLHVGWGVESDQEIDDLLSYIISMSESYDFPLYIETHRSTITQDMQRTVEMTKRFPEIRFNGDFSHYYTGQEMVYGGIENKWEFISPIFNRVRFVHARIGNPGSIQVDIANGKKTGICRSFQGDVDTCFCRVFKISRTGGLFVFYG